MDVGVESVYNAIGQRVTRQALVMIYTLLVTDFLLLIHGASK